MQLSDYFRPAAEALTHSCMVPHRQLHTLASTHMHENKGDLYMCAYNWDFLHHRAFPENAAMFGTARGDLMQFCCSRAWYLRVCVHTWAYVTGRPAETCVLRVAPGNAGESNLGSVKASEMCLSAPRELVSWFLFDRLKLWHQAAPKPPPLTTPSSSSKATTPAVHIAAIYLQLVPFLQTFFLTWRNVIFTAWVMVLTSHHLTSTVFLLRFSPEAIIGWQNELKIPDLFAIG